MAERSAAEPTPCPVEDCEETVDYRELIDHLYAEHDAMDLCATIANLVAEKGNSA